MNDFELLKRDHSTEHFPKHNQSQCRVCSLIKHHDQMKNWRSGITHFEGCHRHHLDCALVKLDQITDQLTVSESDNDKMFDEGYFEGWADALEGPYGHWSHELPFRAGWYWVRGSSGMEAVRIYVDCAGNLSVDKLFLEGPFVIATLPNYPTTKDLQWIGPIPEPSLSSQMAQEARSKLERVMGLPEREVSAEGSTEAT